MSGPTITHWIHESNNELIKSLKTGQGLQGQKIHCLRCVRGVKRVLKRQRDVELIQKKFFYIFIALYNLIQNVVLLSQSIHVYTFIIYHYSTSK